MDVNLLKRKLNSEKTDERLSGLREAIAESEALAVYVIKDYIKTEKSETVLSAMIIACAKIGGEAEIDFIGSFLSHHNFKVQKYAFQSLLLIDSPAAGPYIIKTMTEKDPRLKQMAVKAIRESGKKKSLGTIESMLISEVEWQRVAALEVLEMLNNILYENELIDILVRAISSSKKDFCSESVQKLKKIYDTGSEYAVESVKKLIDSPASPELKKIIYEAIPGSAPKEKAVAEVKAEKDASGIAVSNVSGIDTIKRTGEKEKEKEEEVIIEFSNYIDNVVKSHSNKKIIVSGAVEKTGMIRWLSLKLLSSLKWAFFFPFRLAVRHKYKTGAALISVLILYLCVCPEIILGKGSFSDLKPVSQHSLDELLEGKGYKVNRDKADNIMAFSHDYWVTSIGLIESYFGKSVIFSAYEVNLKNSEIFEGRAFFDKYGAAVKVSNIKNLTETSMADEEELIILKSSFSYLSSTSDGLKILTVQEGDHTNKRQFLFKQNIEISSITNSSLAVNLLKIETKKGENLRNVSLNVDSGNIDPPDFPVEYLPYIDADEPFLPRLVEKVRNLGFVGPEKIARLEDFYYGATDYFKRKLYSGYEEEEEAGRITKGSETGEEIDADESVEVKIAAAAGTDASLEVGSAPAGIIIGASGNNEDLTANKVALDTIIIKAPLELSGLIIKNKLSGGLSDYLNDNVELSKSIAGITGAVKDGNFYNAINTYLQNLQAEKLAAPLTVEVAPGVIFPANIEPLLKKNAIKDEGIWSSVEVSLINSTQPIAFKTKLRVDSKRTFAIMHFLCMDISKANLVLVPGTNEPVSSIGLKGRGVIPQDEQTYQNLICAFNGGFRTKHGKWGFIADGVSYMPPVKGVATITVDSKGFIKMGTWGGKGFDTTENIVHLRQNLPPILENNVVNMKHDYWGASIDNKTRVWRSALGISRDGRWLIYGAGNSLGHDTLAAGMSLAGCDYAMQLDINDYHTYLYTYKTNGTDKKGNLKLKPVRLTDEMSGEAQRCLQPYTRDFFYITFKQYDEIKTASSR
jgi:hypothetical protein